MEMGGEVRVPQRLFTSAQTIVDTAALRIDVGETQLDPGLDLCGGMAQESPLKQGASPAVATGLSLGEGATMKLSGRQHAIMMT